MYHRLETLIQSIHPTVNEYYETFEKILPAKRVICAKKIVSVFVFIVFIHRLCGSFRTFHFYSNSFQQNQNITVAAIVTATTAITTTATSTTTSIIPLPHSLFFSKPKTQFVFHRKIPYATFLNYSTFCFIRTRIFLSSSSSFCYVDTIQSIPPDQGAKHSTSVNDDDDGKKSEEGKGTKVEVKKKKQKKVLFGGHVLFCFFFDFVFF